MDSFDVKFEGRAIGSVTVVKEGLYYRFCCQCKLSKEVVYKLVVSCGGHMTVIGICVPQSNGFGLEKRIPVKRVGEGHMEFQVIPYNQESSVKIVPIDPNAPFKFIPELHQGTLRITNGGYEIHFPSKLENTRE